VGQDSRADAASICCHSPRTLNWGTKCLESIAYHGEQRERSYQGERAISHIAETEVDPVS